MSLQQQRLGEQPVRRLSKKSAWVGGIAFTFAIAASGKLLAMAPGFALAGQMACAILIAILYRQFFGYPEALRSGITFSSKRLLRAAIILYGLKLSIYTVLSDGLGLLLQDAGVIIFSMLITMWLARIFKADKSISLLLGVGTGVCGAAAIAAVAPIVKSEDDDTAISVGIIALMGTMFSLTYTILRPNLPLDAVQYGIWAGTTLHEVAHVALAAAPSGEEGMAFALLAKLGRVFLLVPLCLLFIFIMKQKNKNDEKGISKIEFPWFLVGFVLLSLLGSFVFGRIIPVPSRFFNVIFTVTAWLLTAAMVGLGLNVSLKDLRTKAMRPLAVMMVTSLALSLIVYFLVKIWLN